MALSADEKWGFFFERAIGEESLVAAPVDNTGLVTVLDALTKLHGRAYKWPASFDAGQLIRELGAQPVRTFVRAALEALDLQYVYNENIRLAAATLDEQKLEEDSDFF
ncbi:hypothetical protein [Sporomusa sp.]|uniref:hypothetical protein n=1 Tax=Sporomusa sp. TaxID=2078658 RepID=UPI002C0EA4F4|nr:hypothetical protein [Sporomusa sp.]HWR45807.1 hypothetical protein [Sporomusa sp.]